MDGKSSNHQRRKPKGDKQQCPPTWQMLKEYKKALHDFKKAIDDAKNSTQKKEDRLESIIDKGQQNNEQKRSNGIALIGVQIARFSAQISHYNLVVSIAYMLTTALIFIWTCQGLKETRKEFNLINQPNIQIRDATLGFDSAGGVDMGYNIWNLGPSPANAIGRTDTLIFVPKEDLATFIANPFAKINTARYSNYTAEYYSSDKENRQFGYENIDQHTFPKFLDKDVLAFLIIACEYKNPISGFTRKFRCVMQMNPLGKAFSHGTIRYATTAYNYIIDSNYDTKTPIE